MGEPELDLTRPLAQIGFVNGVFKIVAGAVLAVALLLSITGLVLPRKWQVEHALLVNAEPRTIHTLVSDLRRWPEWADGPAGAQFEYEYVGPESGAGTARRWDGPRTGSGRFEIVRSDPNGGVWFESHVGGDEVTGNGSITYEVGAAGTQVKWNDRGTLPPIYGPFLRDGLEKQVQAHFEAGLLRLKALAEASELEAASSSETTSDE